MSRLTRLIRFARHWHARIGVLAAIFFLTLAVTGVALNHTQALRLDKRPVAAPWLMHWYGLHAEIPSHGYLFEHGYLAWDAQRWSMDGKPLPAAGAVVGAVEVAGVRYVATASTLYLYQPDGSLLDKLGGSALPVARIQRIGSAGGELLVQGAEGAYASADGLDWRLHSAQVGWSSPQLLPREAHAQLASAFSPSLPLERVLLDVHSGRIFGSYGPLLMDLAALILMMLSLSGVWIYLRSIRRRH